MKNLTKQGTITLILIALAGLMLLTSGCEVEKGTPKESGVVELSRPDVVTSGDEALELLKEGNERFVADTLAKIDTGQERREKLTAGQKPFAIILSCSDSRVPPELVFDQGLGDLFIIRVAGNVDDTISIGSIEYAAEHLHTPLLVVMGHSKCGAVTATIEGGDVPPNIAAIAAKISPAVAAVKAHGEAEGEELIEESVVENVKTVIKSIEANSPILKELAESGKIKIVGAKYHLDSGEVEFLEGEE